MFYRQCNNCNERWELGTGSTCSCVTNASATISVDKFSHLVQRTWVELDEEDYIKAYELCDFDKVAAFEFFESKLKEKNT
jgi:hypothetical protein